MKTSELTGAALDWAVAKADDNLYPVGDVQLLDGRLIIIEPGDYERTDTWRSHNPIKNWAQGGPIIEREKISIIDTGDASKWEGRVWDETTMNFRSWYGTTPLIAAMRCYVASKLGDEVEIPFELGE